MAFPINKNQALKQKHFQLSSMSMVNALGTDNSEIFRCITSSAAQNYSSFNSAILGKKFPIAGIETPLPEVPQRLSSYNSRNFALSLKCLEPMLPEINSLIEKFGPSRIAVIMGTSTSGIQEGEDAIRERLNTGNLPADYSYSQQEIGSVSSGISAALELSGPSYTVSTACSSSAKVFGSAMGLLDSGLCDAAIVGGVDTLCGLTLNGFGSLELLSDKVSSPFSKNRSGINIGEAACIFLLTKEPGGIQLLSVGESSDAYHFSSPDPEGKGAAAAIQSALEQAGLSAGEINYLNLHGTGTNHNDLAEAIAVANTFGDSVSCSSTKPYVGHTLGASGATELGFTWLILKEYLKSGRKELHLPLHLFDGEYDENLPRINLITKETYLSGLKSACCISNSFGFGGSNCSVIISAGLK